MGDLMDMYCFSKFAKKLGYSSDKEIRSARYFAEKMWADINKHCPKAEKHQLMGNHCVRMIKRAQENLPEAQDIVSQYLTELYTFPDVKTHFDYRDPLWIKDIKFLHGYRKHGTHMTVSHSKTVVGHTHKAGIVYLNAELPNGKKKLIWEANSGFLADENKFQDILGYTQEKMTGWTLGWLIIIDYKMPCFVSCD